MENFQTQSIDLQEQNLDTSSDFQIEEISSCIKATLQMDQ